MSKTDRKNFRVGLLSEDRAKLFLSSYIHSPFSYTPPLFECFVALSVCRLRIVKKLTNLLNSMPILFLFSSFKTFSSPSLCIFSLNRAKLSPTVREMQFSVSKGCSSTNSFSASGLFGTSCLSGVMKMVNRFFFEMVQIKVP